MSKMRQVFLCSRMLIVLLFGLLYQFKRIYRSHRYIYLFISLLKASFLVPL